MVVVWILAATASFAQQSPVRTFGGGFSTRWKTHGAHGHDQSDPCQDDQIFEGPGGTWGVGKGDCDGADFARGNLDDSIGYRAGIERDFLSAGVFRLVGSADMSMAVTEYNISQRDFMVFGGAASGGIDATRWGIRAGLRYGTGLYAISERGAHGVQTFRELVVSLPLRSGASLRIARRNVENRRGVDRNALMLPSIEVDETSVMFVASPEVKDSPWEFSTASGTSFPGGVGDNRQLKPAGWHRLTASRELPWPGYEARATWTAFAHESRLPTDFRGYPGNERSKTVDSFGLALWRAWPLGSAWSVHAGGGVEVADWRDEHHLLLDHQRNDVIGGVESALVAGGAMRLRLGRGTALEVHAEQAFWSNIGLGETRCGIALVLTR